MTASPTLSSSSSSPSGPQPISVNPNQPGAIVGGRQVLPNVVSSGPSPTAVPGTAGPPPPPSNPRPANARASTNSGITPGATSQITPVKDQDGKFPCPHCPKTYLHAKHLKRHLLRHTGDRPYQCVLCKDTFSRSDILKRHFQKCSIRRGNPTGATHLSHAHAHQQGKQANNQNNADATSISTPSTVAGGLSPSAASPGGKKKSTRACDQCVRLKVRCDLANPCERCRTKGGDCTYSKSLKRQDSREESGLLPPTSFAEQVGGMGQTVGYASEGFNFPPPAHPQAHMAQQGHQQQQAIVASQQRPPQSAAPHQQPPRQLTNVSQPPTSTGYYANSHTQPPNGEVDWSSFMHVPDPAFMDPFYIPQTGGPSTDSGTPTTTASIEHSGGGGTGGSVFTLYNGGSDPSAMNGILGGFNGWTHLAMHQIDPLQAKCDQLIAVCFPESLDQSSPGSGSPNLQIKQEPGNDADLKSWLTPDHVKNFVHLFFLNFQGHFPMIHLPTFNITLIYDGLLLAIICIGAVYAEGISVDQVRTLIDKSFEAMDRNAAPPGPLEIEEIQARYFLHVLATWHGHLHQREDSRRKYGKVIQKARQAGLFQPLSPSNPGTSTAGYSIYHQLDDQPVRGNWNWNAWLEQEKRNRVMFGIFLLNSAFVIFFNSPPQIQPNEIRLPLPADDAAWEARDANECANALGLNGEDGISQNIAGSRQVRQPEFILALRSLLQMHLDFNPGTTNAYSKFILIHALHVHIWTTQKLMSNASEMGIGKQIGSTARVGTGEWKLDGQNRNGCGAPEGFGDSEIAMSDAAKAVRITQYALEKWKRAWDTDLAAQYPSPESRKGFGRDGVPFYLLGKLYLARNRTIDWRHGVDDDKTVSKVKNMLKHVQGFITDGTGRLDLQGAVSAIDEGFAMDELTYDMKLLFRPMEEIDNKSPLQQPRELLRPGNNDTRTFL